MMKEFLMTVYKCSEVLPKPNINVLIFGPCGGRYIGQFQNDNNNDGYIFRVWEDGKYRPKHAVAWAYIPEIDEDGKERTGRKTE